MSHHPSSSFLLASVLVGLVLGTIAPLEASARFVLGEKGYVCYLGPAEDAPSLPAKFEEIDGVPRMVARDAAGGVAAVQEIEISLSTVQFLIATETQVAAFDGKRLPLYKPLPANDPQRASVLTALEGDGAIEGLFATFRTARVAKLRAVFQQYGDTPAAYAFVDKLTRPLYFVVKTRGGIGISYSGTGFLLENRVNGVPVLSDNRDVGAVFIPTQDPWVDATSEFSRFLVIPVVHEVGHQVMDLAYDGKQPTDESQVVYHYTNKPSGPSIAFKEGWAEFFEANLFRDSAHFEDREKLPLEIELRQDHAREMRLIYSSLGKKTGQVKSADELVATEGVVSGLFFNLLTHRKLERGLEKTIQVFHESRPKNYVEFIEAFLARFPEDRKLALRVFLESTRYATVSREVPEIYRRGYEAKLAFLKAPAERREELRASWQALKQDYTRMKEALFEQILQSGDVRSAVSSGLWVAYPDPRDLHGRNKSVDLNLVNLDEMVEIPALRELAVKYEIRDSSGHIDEYIVADRIIEARSRAGGSFKDPADLAGSLQGLPEGAAGELIELLGLADK